MAEMARFIKPILGIVPPDPAAIDPRDWLGVARPRPRLRGAARAPAGDLHRAHDDERRRLPRPLVRDASRSRRRCPPRGSSARSSGVRSPGTAYVLLHHYMGEIDGAFRAWGIPKGGTGGDQRGDRQRRPGAGAEIRTNAAVAQVRVRDDRATGVVLESGEEIEAGVVVSPADARRTFLAAPASRATLARGLRGRTSAASSSGARSGKVNLALDGAAHVHLDSGPGRAPARRDQLLARRSTTWSRPTTTPSPGASAAGRTSTSSSPRSSTRRWRRRASTS